jgi:hypothetical protein
MVDYARVVPPVVITDAILTDCSIAEPDTAGGEQEWDSGGTYSAGDQVIRAAAHWTWELAPSGTGTNPPPTTAGESNDDWLSVGPSNRWRALDLKRSTATTGPSPLSYELTPGARTDSIGALGIVADEVTFEVKVDGVTVYTYTQALKTRLTTGWFDYYTGAFYQVPTVYRHDLPPVTNAVIVATFTRDTGDVSVGSLLIGRYVNLGEVEARPESDALNFSTFDREFDGTSVLVPRRSVPKVTETCYAPKAAINKIRKARTDLNAAPALWTGLTDPTDGFADTLTLLGVYRRWTITPIEGGLVMSQLEVEEN